MELDAYRRFLILSFLLCLSMLIACGPAPAPTPAATETAEPTETATATSTPSSTPTIAPTQTATYTSTPTRTAVPPTRTRTATLRPKPTATLTAIPGPAPTLTYAQICAGLAARGMRDIYIIYIHPVPELVWDTTPRQFLVGLCNTLPPPSVPQGRYKIVMSFPDGDRGSTSSSETPAELGRGFNEVSVGPWIPGLENHRARCNMRAVADTQVMYNGTVDGLFHPLAWDDGRTSVGLAIKCGGNFS